MRDALSDVKREGGKAIGVKVDLLIVGHLSDGTKTIVSPTSLRNMGSFILCGRDLLVEAQPLGLNGLNREQEGQLNSFH